MKLQQINNIRPYTIQNNGYNNNNRKNNPSFGNLATGFATFLENNGFLAEFLSIDTTGMMVPRTAQGYCRNRKELGHLNYKAGREEMVRELLSGPAFFYVPMAVIAGSGILNGKAAKVEVPVLDNFGTLMKKTTVDMKNAAVTKENFVNTVINEAFNPQEYTKERNLVDRLKELMLQTVEDKPAEEGIIGKVKAYFVHSKEKKAARKEAVEILTQLNKANGKFVDGADTIMTAGKTHNISQFMNDMSNYLSGFTKKAARTSEATTTFIENFHKSTRNLRYATNIAAIAALSAFLTIIPKIYQTGKDFPGKDGLIKGTAKQDTSSSKPNNTKEVA